MHDDKDYLRGEAMARGMLGYVRFSMHTNETLCMKQVGYYGIRRLVPIACTYPIYETNNSEENNVWQAS